MSRAAPVRLDAPALPGPHPLRCKVWEWTRTRRYRRPDRSVSFAPPPDYSRSADARCSCALAIACPTCRGPGGEIRGWVWMADQYGDYQEACPDCRGEGVRDAGRPA